MYLMHGVRKELSEGRLMITPVSKRRLSGLKHISPWRTLSMDLFVNERDFALLNQDHYIP